MVKEYSCPKPTKKKFQVYILCIALYLAVFFIVPYPIKPFCLLFSIIPFIRFRLKRYYKQYIDYSQVKIGITEERIELLEYGIPSYSIRRNALHIGHYVSFGEWFYVFTELDTNGLTKKQLKKLIRKKKGFRFPYDYAMQRDFPELFGDVPYQIYL